MSACAALALGLALASALPAAGAETQTKTFHYTGGDQLFEVPGGVETITVTAYGAAGSFGDGAMATGSLHVTPGEKLYVEVGGKGGEPNEKVVTCGEDKCWEAPGGWNGGGSSIELKEPGNATGWKSYTGGGGGGASDVQTQPSGLSPTEWKEALPSRLIVAGGGGGAGGEATDQGSGFALGGFGGPSSSEKGEAQGDEGKSILSSTQLGGGGGAGGSGSAGGKGGTAGGHGYGAPGSHENNYEIGFEGFSGQLGLGGHAGNAWFGGHDEPGPGGGGGGGYYGGGGGGAGGLYVGAEENAGSGGGGGAGSSLVPSGGSSQLDNEGRYADSSSGNGEVVMTYTPGANAKHEEEAKQKAAEEAKKLEEETKKADEEAKRRGETTTKTPEDSGGEDSNAACPTFGYTPGHLPPATRGVAYSQQVAAFGATPPYAYSAGQALPAGLAISHTGLLSGTPSAAPGSYPVNVQVLDGVACGSSVSYVLQILAPPVVGLGAVTAPAGGSPAIGVTVPQPGAVTVEALYGPKASGASAATARPVLVARGTARAQKAGRITVKLVPTARGRAMLRGHRRVRVELRVAFTPSGGTRHVQVATRTI